ncbi:hydroxyectoine utilization dehydratase EutB [Maritimibacter sp. UBA3975]|uniref:hydroxyectoine utilization dehydratase EutB n=1 Tax=Maritimibacter sp. UBA3975 TaxID=1946833 RepID=UPI000C0B423A|nr:hydroxyectoine utilization dehydratase EutB [Maritimibacter sp. UBA3975]MAM62012.1 hydroxyectoine utilization dehydratase EutB [Maritimibacter sp.]|tara:strand:- start:36130 stop:37149 length:1020 start_codon:yes stop_codon:yes gene_type:complete
MPDPSDLPVTLGDIRAAARTIAGLADATPMVPSPFMSDRIGHPFWMKLEIGQPTGAFKLRGATNAIRALGDVPGVVCCSTGNHGRAVAYAAGEVGLRAVICMSELVPAAKVERIRAMGAEVVIEGRSQDEAQLAANRLVRDEGLIDIPPFDHPDVIAGQGTIGLEMLDARPEIDTVIIPLSGGGLAAGVAVAAKAIKPGIRLIGVTMENGAAMDASLKAGKPVDVTEVASLADSLGGGIGLTNRYTFPICRDLLDEVVLVTEGEILTGMQTLYYEDALVAEGACAVAHAALLAGKITVTGPTATIITGRNLDMQTFTRLMAGEDVALGDTTLKGQTYGA